MEFKVEIENTMDATMEVVSFDKASGLCEIGLGSSDPVIETLL